MGIPSMSNRNRSIPSRTHSVNGCNHHARSSRLDTGPESNHFLCTPPGSSMCRCGKCQHQSSHSSRPATSSRHQSIPRHTHRRSSCSSRAQSNRWGRSLAGSSRRRASPQCSGTHRPGRGRAQCSPPRTFACHKHLPSTRVSSNTSHFCNSHARSSLEGT